MVLLPVPELVDVVSGNGKDNVPFISRLAAGDCVPIPTFLSLVILITSCNCPGLLLPVNEVSKNVEMGLE